MENDPMVSVIVPVYNVEKYLDKCLYSIVQQTYSNIEIIIVNDGSTDTSPLIIKKYSEKDNRIIVVDKPNGGLASARNAGVKRAHGLYIWHVDSDDYFESDSLLRMVECALREHADIVIAGYFKEYEDREYVESVECRFSETITGLEALNLMLQQRIGGEVWTKLYKKELYIQDNISQNEQFSEIEDTLLNFQLLKIAKVVSPLDFNVVHHLYRLGSYSSSSKTIQFRIKHHQGIQYMPEYSFVGSGIERAYYAYLFNDYISCVLLKNKELLKKINGFTFKEILIYLKYASKMDMQANVSWRIKLIANFSKFYPIRFMIAACMKFIFYSFR